MNKNLRRGMSKFLSMAFAMSIVLGGASKVKADDNNVNLDDAQIQKIKEQLCELSENQNKDQKINTEYKDQEEVVRVVVELIGKSASESSEGEVTPQAISAVKAAQGATKAQASVLEGAKIRHSYGNVVNGFSMDVKRKEMDRLRQLPGVKSVKEANKYKADMNNAKKLTQAFDAWKNYNLKGEGMLVAIVDTGVDKNHKDMSVPKDSSKLKLTKQKVEELTKSGVLRADKDAETYFTDKVPFGYNYADKNNEILDKRPDAGHGMHVSGIVAANGTDEEIEKGQAIKGVAPEAQLLAMKVFSNGEKGEHAYTDDIVAGIEDSVTLGADVINMSLGAASGFQYDEDLEQKAISNAAKKGIAVVVSAGNSSYSTAPYRDKTMKDISTVGTPALAKDALMVANYQNTHVTGYVANFADSNGTIFKNSIYSEHMVKFKDDKEFEVVNCGMGKPEDFTGKDLKGKVALIIRGGLNFTVKILNAQQAGAAGAIIYNHEAGGEELIKMATDNDITIPAIFIGNSGGKTVLDKLDKGEKVKFKFLGKPMTEENSQNGDYDDSTSWGCSPNLEFKPQIAAPGGNIFSTVNNNRYDNYSGTSMSAPHVSGGMALILESIKGYNTNLKGKDLVNYAKSIAMNTSSIKMDKTNADVPFSPRRQGSGLIQIADAIRNRVTATCNGEASVALKEIKDKKVNFTIDLNNYGDKDATYSLENFKGVLSQEDKDAEGEMARDVVLGFKDANISFDVSEVTVKAGSSAKVNVTLNIGNDLKTENFLEGYIKLNSKNDETPSLVVPFMGYYGDWTKERIINYASWEKSNTKMATVDEGELLSGAATFNSKGEGYLVGGKDSSNIAISPNDDKDYEDITPYLYMLRNARKMTAEVLDEKGKVVRKIGEREFIERSIYKSEDGKKPALLSKFKWDGKIGNKVAREGQYTLSIKSYVDLPNAKAQEFKIPVKVDVTAPTFEIVSAAKSKTNTYTVKWKQHDNLSGVDFSGILLNGKLVKDAKIKHDETTDVYSADITLVEGKINEIVVAGFDNAYNFGASTIKIDKVAPMVQVLGVENNKVYNTSVKPVITVDDKEATVATTLNGKPYDGKEITEDGQYELIVTAVDKADNKTEVKVNFAIDKTAPTITIKGVENDKVYNNSVTPVVTVDDKDAKVVMTLNGKPYDGKEIAEDGKYELVVMVTDKTGNKTEIKVNFAIDKTAPTVTVTGVENNKVYNTSVKPVITVDDKEATVTTTLNGNPYDGEEITKDGEYELIATVADKAGNKTEVKVNFVIDKTVPTVTVTGVENNKVYNASVKPVITVDDKEATVTTTLNGNPYNGEEIAKDGEYELIATVTDKAGNKTEVKVKFAIDKTAPTVTITGVENGKIYDKEVTPEIKVDDKDATLKIMLNGKEYDGKTTVKEEGKYKLEIVATDKVGNAKETTIEFEIKLPSKDKNEEKPAENQKTGNDNETSVNKNTNETNTNTSKLAKTGSVVNGNLLMSLGGTLMGIGAAFVGSKKRKNNK